MATILIVDDEPEMRAALRGALESRHHTVIEAASGLAGLSEVRSGTIDLVVLDVVMPEMDGFEMLMKMRELGRRIPVIAMSGRPHKELYAQTATALGAADTLLKPFQLSELIESVDVVLSQTKPPAV